MSVLAPGCWIGRRAWLGALLVALTRPIGASPPRVSLEGVVDLHCHSGPDAQPRSLSDSELVRMARQAGLSAVVLKNHFTQTADRAQLARLPGIEVFGGIVLNRAVGGLNPEAVRRMLQFEGGRGRVVWLPTVDARSSVEDGAPFVAVLEDGQPAPGLREVLALVAEHDLLLATGHSTPEEVLALLPIAREAGVRKVLVTHALDQGPSLEQLREMIERGALLELICPGSRGARSQARSIELVKTLGADALVIASDLGQPGNPLPTLGLRAFLASLAAAGVSARDLERMTRDNPARLVGLVP